jgi:hypothetical protein
MHRELEYISVPMCSDDRFSGSFHVVKQGHMFFRRLVGKVRYDRGSGPKIYATLGPNYGVSQGWVFRVVTER